jgi:trimeric autotransporter adhesin
LNTTGQYNSAFGSFALDFNTTGDYNTAIGYNAGTSSGSFNNTISIGNGTYLNGASNQAFFGGTSTIWNGGNVSWSTFSDERVKKDISEDVKGLAFISRLHPVTYYRSVKAMAQITGNKEAEDYPGKYDIEKIKFSGFLAQEVEQAANEAGYNFSGITKPKTKNDLYSLSYETFVVPLVKAVQELAQYTKEQQKTIEEQGKKIDYLVQQLETIKNKNK